jgi:hypothetical protein
MVRGSNKQAVVGRMERRKAVLALLLIPPAIGALNSFGFRYNTDRQTETLDPVPNIDWINWLPAVCLRR